MKMRNKVNDRFVEERVSFIAAIFKAIFLALKRVRRFSESHFSCVVLYLNLIYIRAIHHQASKWEVARTCSVQLWLLNI